MEKMKYLLCALLLVSGCVPKNEPEENEHNKVVEPATNSDNKDQSESGEQPEKEVEDQSSEPDVPSSNTDIKPAEPEAIAPMQPPVTEEENEEAEIDLEALSAAIQKTDIFSMSMLLDSQQIADLYGNIGTDQYETAIVLKNMISPGGDETAIFKVKADQMEAVKAGINTRDEYGKNEGSFYEMEQEMFNTSKIIEIGDIIVYVAARNVDEVAEIVNQAFK